MAAISSTVRDNPVEGYDFSILKRNQLRVAPIERKDSSSPEAIEHKGEQREVAVEEERVRIQRLSRLITLYFRIR